MRHGVVPVILICIAFTAAAQAREWLPLDQAVAQASGSGRLILLHLHAGTVADRESDTWISSALEHDAIVHSLDEMVLATARIGDPVLDRFAEIHELARHRQPQLIVLDPAGGVVTGLVAFKSFGEVAAALSSLREQSAMFARSAHERAEGQPAAAAFSRGLGLAKAGATVAARTAFELADDLSRRANDPVMRQRAQLGSAALDMDAPRRGVNGLNEMMIIAEHPRTPEIGANAWLLIGDRRREMHDPRRALEAFTKAYGLAEPGSDLAIAARLKLEAMGAPLPGSDAPSPATGARVHLIFPRRAVLAGNLDVVATAPETTARLEYLVDDARVTESYRPPYRATLPLGNTPRTHTLRAVAYDERNRKLADDLVTINDHVERLSVEIVSPKTDEVASATDIEVVPHVPDEDALEGVDLFWNETRLATLTAPPFRTALTLPSPNAFGYIRAVARSRGGAIAEDAKLMNPTATVDNTRVDAVELYAIVQDRSGHNVEGLSANDFDVKEDGRHVDVALHGTPLDPITVGLALDTSGSMRASMMDVAEDARTFLRDSLTKGDRSFLVAFDDEPHLAQPLTADLQHVSAEIFDARARGATAIWDAIAFSLAQLKGVEGKRALLVFTDGADNGSHVRPEAVRALARETGAPVYIVLMESPVYESMLRSRQSPSRFRPFEDLAKESGGALFTLPKASDLPRLFARVRDDTRGEYVLSFVSKSTSPRGTPRALKIDVPRRHVVVRAPASYLAR